MSGNNEKLRERTRTLPVDGVSVADTTVPSSPPDPWRRPERRAMARKKVSTTIYIEPEQLDQLKLLNERTKVPMAEYIREGIDLVLQKHQDKLPGQLPLDAATIRRSPASSSSSSSSDNE